MKAAFIRKLMALVLACGLVAGISVVAGASSALGGIKGSGYSSVWDPAEGIWNIISESDGSVITTISAPGPNGEPAKADGTTAEGGATTGETSTGYAVQLGEVMNVYKDGKSVNDFPMRDGKISFTSDASGNLYMRFVDDEDKTRLLSFGEEKILTVSGSAKLVTFSKGLNNETFVNITEDANFQKVTINSAGTFNNRGNINHAEINGSATFISGANSHINGMTITKGNAKVITDASSYIGTIYSVSSRPLSNMTVPARNGVISVETTSNSVISGSKAPVPVEIESVKDEKEDEEEVPTVGATGTISDNITTTK